jgi:hypothetical protein
MRRTVIVCLESMAMSIRLSFGHCQIGSAIQIMEPIYRQHIAYRLFRKLKKKTTSFDFFNVLLLVLASRLQALHLKNEQRITDKNILKTDLFYLQLHDRLIRRDRHKTAKNKRNFRGLSSMHVRQVGLILQRNAFQRRNLKDRWRMALNPNNLPQKHTSRLELIGAETADVISGSGSAATPTRRP